jgi:hypothetical protein
MNAKDAFSLLDQFSDPFVRFIEQILVNEGGAPVEATDEVAYPFRSCWCGDHFFSGARNIGSSFTQFESLLHIPKADHGDEDLKTGID